MEVIAFCAVMAVITFVLQRASRKYAGMSFERLMLTNLFKRKW